MFKKHLIVDVGNHTTKVGLIQFKGRVLHVLKGTSFPTPEGVLSEGVVVGLEILSQKLAQEIKINKLKATDISFIVSGAGLIFREVTIPKVKKNKIEAMVRSVLGKNVPVSLTDYELDYTIIAEDIEEGVSSYKIHVTLLPLVVVNSYWLLSEKLQMRAGVLTTHLHGIVNAIGSAYFDIKEVTEKVLVFVDYGYKHTSCLIVEYGVPVADKFLPAGTSIIDGETLVNYTKKYGNQGEITDFDDVSGVVLSFSSVIAQIASFLTLHERSKNTAAISCIYIYGGGSKIPMSVVEFEKSTKLTTKVLKFSSNVVLHTPLEGLENIIGCASCLLTGRKVVKRREK